MNLLQIDFLLEGFYTTLENPFVSVSTGATLSNGSILEEVRNGSGAMVYGFNIEFGISPIQSGNYSWEELFSVQNIINPKHYWKC